MRRPSCRWFALGLILLFANPAQGDLTGTVTLRGAPQSQDETFVAKAFGCEGSSVRKTENWKIGPKGELGDVVVWLVAPKYTKVVLTMTYPLPGPMAIMQQGCRYIPHVAVETAGVPFTIGNNDRTLHNIRAKVDNGPDQPPGDDVFNFGQSHQGQRDDRQFDAPGLYTLHCDVHAWMQCYIKVLPAVAGYPYPSGTITNLQGVFSIPTEYLADGSYEVRAWHPRFADELSGQVTVIQGTAHINFQFDGAKSF